MSALSYFLISIVISIGSAQALPPKSCAVASKGAASPQKMTETGKAERWVWSKASMAEVILAFKNADLPVTYAAVLNGGKAYFDIMTDVIQAESTLSSLVRAKPEKAWTWKKSLKALDLKRTAPRASAPEPTAEEISLVIKAFVAAKLPVNYSAVKGGSQVYSDVVLATLGRKVSLSALVTAKPKEGWSWSMALEIAEVKFSEGLQRRGPWSEDEIVSAIQDFHEAGLPITYGAVDKGGPLYSAVLKKKYRTESTGSLKLAIIRKNWNWAIALEKAGFDPKAEFLSFRWSAEKIILLIQEFKKHGLPVNYTAIETGGEVYLKIIRSLFGEKRGLGVLHAKPEPAWNWDIAMERAGLDPKEERGVFGEWSPQEIILLIQEFKKRDLPINFAAISDHGALYLKISDELFGNERGLGFLQAKPEPTWTWDVAMERAGFDPKEESLRIRAWSSEDIVLLIQEFKKADLPIHYAAIGDNSDAYLNIVRRLFGDKRGLGFLRARPEEGWTWDVAMERAGFNPKQERRVFGRWSAEQIVQVIQEFDRQGLPVNYTAVENGGEAYLNIIRDLFDDGRGFGFLSSKPETGWNWNVALVRAGLNPNEVRLRGTAPVETLSEELRADFIESFEAIQGTRGYEGDELVPTYVEDHAQENYEAEASMRLEGLADQMSRTEQALLAGLLEYFETHSGLDVPEILKFFKKEKGLEASAEQIIEVVKIIQSDPSILELRDSN